MAAKFSTIDGYDAAESTIRFGHDGNSGLPDEIVTAVLAERAREIRGPDH